MKGFIGYLVELFKSASGVEAEVLARRIGYEREQKDANRGKHKKRNRTRSNRKGPEVAVRVAGVNRRLRRKLRPECVAEARRRSEVR